MRIYASAIARAIRPETIRALEPQSMITTPGQPLSNIALLLLIDLCESAEKRYDARIAEVNAHANGDRSIDFLQNLKQSHTETKMGFLAQLRERGLTDEDIHKQLALLAGGL